jgi:O-acetyl-ADP-ribose deacetylase (regulator of RNase III)
MRIIYSGQLKNVRLTFALGDLFDAEADAIVNSEQTDFILSGNRESISGQIWYRYGDSVQQELDDATSRQVFPPGTVFETNGGEDFYRIFHAGFHDPDDWPDDARTTDFFEAIGDCTSQILRSAIQQGLKSVAFPLIGCGIFGLDEKMLIEQFLDAVERFDTQTHLTKPFNIWLVIRDYSQFESTAGKLIDMLLSARHEMVAVQLDLTHVPILDGFCEKRLARRTSEEWAKFQLCQFAEIALDVMYYSLTCAKQRWKSPKEIFPKGIPPTFGERFRLASELANALPADSKFWGSQIFATVLRNKQSRSAMDTLITQRNALAHGRESKPLATIVDLVRKSLRLYAWTTISEAEGPFQPGNWIPWIRLSATSQTGLFDRWQENWIRYVVPETGEVFRMTCP